MLMVSLLLPEYRGIDPLLWPFPDSVLPKVQQKSTSATRKTPWASKVVEI